jgi:hypothetical protein
MIPSLIKDVYHKCPMPVRRRISSLKVSCLKLAVKMRLKPIRVDACLLGGDDGISATSFTLITGDVRRASMPISEWPHVKLLRQYDSIREQIWDRRVFEETEYYQNAVLNIEMLGSYHGAIVPSEIQQGAHRFVTAYCGLETHPLQEGNIHIKDSEEIAVNQVKDSACYQVVEGRHRLAIAYMKGIKEVPGLILQPPVLTPLQQLLLDILWINGPKRELYQPIESPEVAGWTLVRRCSDRLAMMTGFLRTEGLMPPVSSNYLDVASYFGWFVAEMQKAGFKAEGIERDPIAISVGRVMYGLRPEQVHRSDCIPFLRGLQDKYDVTSCFSLLHHYLWNRSYVSAEEMLRLLDSATRRVMFFGMGQGGERFSWGEKLASWDADHIQHWLEANTTFSRIVRLGEDKDNVPPYEGCYGRTVFACVR